MTGKTLQDAISLLTKSAPTATDLEQAKTLCHQLSWKRQESPLEGSASLSTKEQFVEAAFLYSYTLEQIGSNIDARVALINAKSYANLLLECSNKTFKHLVIQEENPLEFIEQKLKRQRQLNTLHQCSMFKKENRPAKKTGPRATFTAKDLIKPTKSIARSHSF